MSKIIDKNGVEIKINSTVVNNLNKKFVIDPSMMRQLVVSSRKKSNSKFDHLQVVQ